MDGFAVGRGEREIIRNPVGGDLTFLVRAEQSNGTVLAVAHVSAASSPHPEPATPPPYKANSEAHRRSLPQTPRRSADTP
jgi:hypothetical protein